MPHPAVSCASPVRSWLSWIERLTTNQKAAGSSPAERAPQTPLFAGVFPAIGDGLRLLERALDAVGHEGVDATLGTLCGRLVRDHEQRSAGRARRSPTTEGSRRRCSCRR